MEFVLVALMSVIVYRILIEPRLKRLIEHTKHTIGDRLGVQYASAQESFLEQYWVFVQERPEVLSQEDAPLGAALIVASFSADQLNQMYLILSQDKQWRKSWFEWAYPVCVDCGGAGCRECRASGRIINPLAFMGVGMPDYDGNSGNPFIHRLLHGPHSNVSGKHPAVRQFNQLIDRRQ